MASLADQLLNMGVVDKKKAKKSQHQQRQTATKNRKALQSGKTVKSDTIQQDLAQAQHDKQQRDRDLNKQRDAELASKAQIAEVGQIIQQHKIEIPAEADIAYNFEHKSKVKKIYVTATQQQELTQAYLAIAITGEHYYLIPDKIAARIEQRLPEYVIRSQAEQQSTDNDPYADYQIPDDLMW